MGLSFSYLLYGLLKTSMQFHLPELPYLAVAASMQLAKYTPTFPEQSQLFATYKIP
jgi:hypothetical protein